MRRLSLCIVVAALLGGCILDKDWKHRGPTQPEPLNDGWAIATPESVGLDARKQSITLDNLLTMRSGLAFDNSDFSVEMWIDKPADPIRHILDKPLYADPGVEHRYRDADPQLVSYAMQRLTGRTEEDLAREYLFGPLGITDYYWDFGGQGETMGAHGLHLRPRDLAKIGQMVLDGGVWQGTRVVSQAWLDVSTVEHVNFPGQRLGYGYYWWTVPEAAGYSTWGHGGQYAFVVPALRLLMVMQSMPDTSPDYLHGGELEQFVDLTRPLWQSP
jgi:CubicO group peptidase (beta-lactamase class C family)